MASSSSSWRGPITQWLENVCVYYFGSKKDESTIAVVDTALSLISGYMQKHPQQAKQQWQNLAMAAFLTSIDLLDLAVDTKPLWDKCEQTCDKKRVTELQKLLAGEAADDDEAEEKKPAATPAATPKIPFTPAPASAAPTPKTPAKPAPTPKIPATPVPEAPAEANAPAPAETLAEAPADDETMTEIPDEEEEQRQARALAQKQKGDDKYLVYVLQESKLRVWPYVFDVEVTAPILSAMDRIFRTYALNIAPKPLTKQEVQNVAAGTILATLQHLKLLPPVKETRLIAKLYDDYPLSSKQGIKNAWEAIKNVPDLLATKLTGL